MKQALKALLEAALTQLQTEKKCPADVSINIVIERARDKKFGDYASNIALTLAKSFKCPPKEVAQFIIEAIPENNLIKKMNIAGPGFINFFVEENVRTQIIEEVLDKGESFGKSDIGAGQKVILEFVSANPTGPLHVGHGRGAAFGSSLANILEAAGFEVHREYYVNDAGRQMAILAVSVWLRYLALNDITLPFPSNAYQGDYVIDIAQKIKKQYGGQFVADKAAIVNGLPKDACDGGDKEIYVDALIKRAKELLQDDFNLIHQFGLDDILLGIKADLSAFSLDYQQWYSESSLFTSKALDKGIAALKEKDLTYEKEGALWFKSTQFGDEKDRVLKRANGQTTYFASDVAYHWDKYQRGFDKVVDIFGADHHGYVVRVKAAAEALGEDAKKFAVFLVQFAILYRGQERVQMSTRSGSFVTLKALSDEIGVDAARFFYVVRKAEQHMDFDLELAKSHSNDNPVYYVQYAYARICSIFNQLKAKGFAFDKKEAKQHLHKLENEQEIDLLRLLLRYKEVIISAANKGEPHLMAYYLRELAHALHTYYNAHQFIVEDELTRNARLALIASVQQVLKNGLALIGVSAPRQM